MGKTYRTPAGRTAPLDFTINEEKFVCLPSVKGSLLPDLWGYIEGDDAGAVKRDAVMEFFAEVMEGPEFERFTKFVEDVDNIVHAQLLLEITMDLLAEYGGRPTRRSSLSQPGPSNTGPGSNRGSSSPTSPSSKSP